MNNRFEAGDIVQHFKREMLNREERHQIYGVVKLRSGKKTPNA